MRKRLVVAGVGVVLVAAGAFAFVARPVRVTESTHAVCSIIRTPNGRFIRPARTSTSSFAPSETPAQ